MRCFTAVQDLKPERLIEANRSAHVVGRECDGAQSLDHGGPLNLFCRDLLGRERIETGQDGGLTLGDSAVVSPRTQGDHAASIIRSRREAGCWPPTGARTPRRRARPAASP